MRRFHLVGLLIGAALLAAAGVFVAAQRATAPRDIPPVAQTPPEPVRARHTTGLPATPSPHQEAARTERPAVEADVSATAQPQPLVGAAPPPQYTGFWRTWHPNGALAEEIAYRNGQLDGPWRTWYEDGLPKEDVTYRNGWLDGRHRTWHPGGRLAAETEFRNGIQEGSWMSWYESGQPQIAGTIRNGIPDGRWRIWDSAGRLLETLTPKDM